MPMTNPYLNRQPISHPGEFFGRAGDVRWLLERILHPIVPQCCSITGLRRIGKSSFLRFIEHEEGARLAYPEFFEGQARLLFVYADLSRASAERADGDALALETLRHLLRSLERKVRRQLGGELGSRISALKEGAGEGWLGIQEALEDALYLLDEEGYRLIFLLDEMDVAQAWNSRLVAVLRALVIEHQVAYVTASLDPLFELMDEGITSPLYNLFSSRPLGLLEPGEALALLVEPARALGRHWSRELVERLLEETGGHPDLIKRAAAQLWDLAATTGAEPTAGAVLDALRPDARALFASLWDHLDGAERQLIASIAVGHGIPSGAAALLPALQQRAILVEGVQGPQLFGRLFGRWVQEQGAAPTLQDGPRLEGRWLHLEGERIQLTPTEVKLTRALLLRRGQTVSREALQRAVWDQDLAEDSKALDTTVQRLRGKIEVSRNEPKWLVTVRGEGYMFQ